LNTIDTCYYSVGSGHELCPHSKWCIFDDKRIITEQRIVDLTNKFILLEKQYNHQKLKGGDILINEEDLLTVKDNLRILEDYERRMIL
jgi:hypothetical protein